MKHKGFKLLGLNDIIKLYNVSERKLQRDCLSGDLEAQKINDREGGGRSGTWVTTTRAVKNYVERQGISQKKPS